MKFQLDIEKRKSLKSPSTVMTAWLGGCEFKLVCNPALTPLYQEQWSIFTKKCIALSCMSHSGFWCDRVLPTARLFCYCFLEHLYEVLLCGLWGKTKHQKY